MTINGPLQYTLSLLTSLSPLAPLFLFSFFLSLVGCSIASASALAEHFGTYMHLHQTVTQGQGLASGPGLGRGPGLGLGLGLGSGLGRGLGQVVAEGVVEEIGNLRKGGPSGRRLGSKLSQNIVTQVFGYY